MSNLNPLQIKIYHISHINNLENIIADDCLWSDYQRIERNIGNTNIGYSHIKERRLQHPVSVAQRGMLGQYTPFNFCPRSVMLYVVNQGHHNYTGGQTEVVHLVSTIGSVVNANRPWFFTDRHADLSYALQYDSLSHINVLNWTAINRKIWKHPDTKELKQAEFLVHDYLPWACVEQIGVLDNTILQRVQNILNSSPHHPSLTIKPDWYY